MKNFACLCAIFIASIEASLATSAAISLSNTITSTDGRIMVYEGTGGAALSISDVGGNAYNGSSLNIPATGSDVYYYVDIVSDVNISVLGVAVSFQDASSSSSFLYLNGSLGTQSTVLGLATGVYSSSSWSILSSVPFATAFGINDDHFIWIAGTTVITNANDVDGSAVLDTNNAHAARSGNAASQFVALGSGGSIVGGSIVPEPSSTLLLLMGACGATLYRRRTR